MGLFDSAASDPGGLYGDMMTPQQKQALAYRGLLGFLGGMQKSGALDYTVPFISGKVPGGLAAGLAGGMAGMGEAQDSAAKNAMSAKLVGLQAQDLENKIGMRKDFQAGDQKLMEALTALMGGQSPASPASPAAQSANAGSGDLSDPRGLAPYIAETAAKYGIDPKTALQVAGSEGLKTFLGDGGKSGGAFQLYTGDPGAVGSRFKADTGLDPLDQKNEKATIDYALKTAAKEGWGAWNGAKKLGITGFQGIGQPRPVQLASADGGMPQATLASMNGTAGPENAAFLQRALGRMRPPPALRICRRSRKRRREALCPYRAPPQHGAQAAPMPAPPPVMPAASPAPAASVAPPMAPGGGCPPTRRSN
jgi:hypothetical protein